MAGASDLYRADGVRITHDPHAAGMREKYGAPGATDHEGFDPYGDSVGPGIYGGVVKRDLATGEVLVGRQYQNHNPRPGPVYAGGGYTPTTEKLGTGDLGAWFERYPELVNEVSTGGSQPLHNCGMSPRNAPQTKMVISHGGDIEALDTYGYTPLMRMASNNHGVGARALLEAGADPFSKGTSGESPSSIARASRATEVLKVLADFPQRRQVELTAILVSDAGRADVNGRYTAQTADRIPPGFDKVCQAQSWDTAQMWRQLNRGAAWFKAENDAYVYYNAGDAHWWIDAPDGQGVYKAPAPSHAPPSAGWKLIGTNDGGRPPAAVNTFRLLEE